MNRSRMAFALGLVVPTLSLAGCSDDPVPKVAPHESPSVVSESPSPTGQQSTRTAQRAALDDYFAAISDAIATGDPSDFLAASSGECQNCRVLAANLSNAYEDGGRIEGGRWVVRSAKFQRKAPLGMVWSISLHTSRERWYDASNHITKIVRPSTLDVGLALELRGERWQVRELRLNS